MSHLFPILQRKKTVRKHYLYPQAMRRASSTLTFIQREKWIHARGWSYLLGTYSGLIRRPGQQMPFQGWCKEYENCHTQRISKDAYDALLADSLHNRNTMAGPRVKITPLIVAQNELKDAIDLLKYAETDIKAAQYVPALQRKVRAFRKIVNNADELTNWWNSFSKEGQRIMLASTRIIK